MPQLVSITSQGQLTIPKDIRQELGITRSSKALIRKQDRQIIVEPQADFWALSGSLKSSVALTDQQLQKARQQFSQKWAKHE
jgi:AbrB family looped-hinge helix DNA binding protein